MTPIKWNISADVTQTMQFFAGHCSDTTGSAAPVLFDAYRQCHRGVLEPHVWGFLQNRKHTYGMVCEALINARHHAGIACMPD